MKKKIFKYLLLMIGTTATAFAGEEVMNSLDKELKNKIYEEFPKSSVELDQYEKTGNKKELTWKRWGPLSTFFGSVLEEILPDHQIIFLEVGLKTIKKLKEENFDKNGNFNENKTEENCKTTIFNACKKKSKYLISMIENNRLETENNRQKKENKSTASKSDSVILNNKLLALNNTLSDLKANLVKAKKNLINANLNYFFKKYGFSEFDAADSTIIWLFIAGVIVLTIISSVIATKVYPKVKESGSQDEFDFFDEDDYGHNY